MSVATHPLNSSFVLTPGFRSEYPESTSGGVQLFFGTLPIPFQSGDDLMEALQIYGERVIREKEFPETGDDTLIFNSTVGASEEAEIDKEANWVSATEFSKLDEVQSIVRAFENLADGWDELGSFAPTQDIVEDALVVLQNWQSGDFIPEPEASVDGKIVLEVYDVDGFTLGGIELVGEHRAIYSVNKRTEVLDKGHFDTTSQTEIIGALSRLKAFWNGDSEP